MSINSYTTFLKARRTAERAIGRYIVERVEAGATWQQLTAECGILNHNGTVKGLDITARAAITLSNVSRARWLAVLKVWNSEAA